MKTTVASVGSNPMRTKATYFVFIRAILTNILGCQKKKNKPLFVNHTFHRSSQPAINTQMQKGHATK
ncbi:MAG TPA: hypothetical protein PK228_21930, partial [Saprospiraceae bacterium]|nr:hypothetical protein [Saprospiraceae bacterium]